MSFDEQTELIFDQFNEKFPEAFTLSELLLSKEPINFDDFKNIPGITKEKLEILHKKHLEARGVK